MTLNMQLQGSHFIRKDCPENSPEKTTDYGSNVLNNLKQSKLSKNQKKYYTI